jgi:hypothetical protein
MDKIDIWEAQCFFRHLAESKRHNDSVRQLNNDQKDFYEKVTFYYGMVPDEIQKISEDIIAQLQKLIVRLIPLYQIGIRYDIYLAGGAIRDLIYGNYKNIKDLDIIFSINEASIVSALKNTPVITLEAILGKEINKHIDWRDDSQVKKVHAFFSYCLSKHYEISRGFTIEDIKKKGKPHQYDNIINQNLEGIITIKDEKDRYPMDVLLTTSSIATYLNTFNFEICKAYIPFFTQKSASFITNPVHFFEQIHVTSGFITDGMNKTITMNMQTQKSIDAIERSINTHLPRIVEKYENHNLVLNAGSNEEYIKWKQKYEDYIKLNKMLPQKVDISSQGEPKKVMKV